MTLSFVLIAFLLAIGLWMLCGVIFFHDTSFEGSAELRLYGKWHEDKRDFWKSSIMKGLTKLASRFVFLDDNSGELLARQLNRAGLTLTPKEFTARRYVILFSGALGAGVCGLMKFWLGVILCVLLAGFGLMKQRDALQAKLKEKDEAISLELPRFVRTICRNLRGNRDIYAALLSYRKVSGPVLGAELDILLAHMRSGNIQNALQQFQARLGSEEVYRLLKEAMSKYLAYRKEKKREKRVSGPVKPMGKQTVKQLVGQNQGVSNIEITDSNIKASAFFFCFSQLSKLSIIASEGCAAA